MSEQSATFDPFSHKPDISDTSRKLYMFNLTKLNHGKPIKNLAFLSKTEILEKIEEMKPNTQRTYLISIVSALKGRTEPKLKRLYSKYYELMMNLNKKLKDNTEKTETVKENWLDQDEVMRKQKEMSGIVAEIAEKRRITEEEYNRLLALIELSLYTLQQPRRNKDYTQMKVVKQVPEEDKTFNYLDTGKWVWVFNNYKTQKKYNQQILPIPDDLKEILKVYLKHHPKSKEIKAKHSSEPFLVKFDGTPIATSPEMTRSLNKIFGKKVGCSMLRSIYLTNKYGKTLEDLKTDVANMGTSAGTAEDNYIKKE